MLYLYTALHCITKYKLDQTNNLKLLCSKYYKLIDEKYTTLCDVLIIDETKSSYPSELKQLKKQFSQPIDIQFVNNMDNNYIDKICYNPICRKKKSQLKRKSKKFYKCKDCKIVTFCSRKCQKIHWKRCNHKQQCKKLQKYYTKTHKS